MIERKSARFLGKGWGTETVEEEFSLALKLLPSRDINLCIDIGGNVGIYSEQILTKVPDSEIVIFEPSESNFSLLNEKFQNNDNVRVENYAVSNDSGTATLYSNEDGSGLASLTKRRLDHFGLNFDKSYDIKTLKFEDYWRNNLKSRHIDFCKIDVEGHEMDVLLGFGDAIEHVSLIQFEFGGCNIDTRTFFQDFWYFFQDKKFKLYRISPLGLIHIPSYEESHESFTTTNYLALKS